MSGELLAVVWLRGILLDWIFVYLLPLPLLSHDDAILSNSDASRALSLITLSKIRGAGSGIDLLKQIRISLVFWGFICILFSVAQFRDASRTSCIWLMPRLHYTQFIGTARLKLVPLPNFIGVQATNTKAGHRWNGHGYPFQPCRADEFIAV